MDNAILLNRNVLRRETLRDYSQKFKSLNQSIILLIDYEINGNSKSGNFGELAHDNITSSIMSLPFFRTY